MNEQPGGNLLSVAETIATRQEIMAPAQKPSRFADVTAVKVASSIKDQEALNAIRARLKVTEPLQKIEVLAAGATIERANKDSPANAGIMQARYEQGMVTAQNDTERAAVQVQSADQLNVKTAQADRELGLEPPIDVIQEMAEIENIMRDEGKVAYKKTHGEAAKPSKEELETYVQMKMAEIGKAYMQAATARFGGNYDKVTRLVSRYLNIANNNRDTWDQVRGVVATPDKTGELESAQDLIARIKKGVLEKALGEKVHNPVAIREWHYTPYGALFRTCELLASNQFDTQALANKLGIQVSDYARSNRSIARFEIDMTGNVSIALDKDGSIVLSGSGRGGDEKAFADAFLVILTPDGKAIARNGRGDDELSVKTAQALQTLVVTARNYVEDIVKGTDVKLPDFRAIRNASR